MSTTPAPDRDRLVELLLGRSFRTGRFALASGRESPWYVDARPTTMAAEGLALIGPLGLAAIRSAGWTPDLVGGLTLGADPVAYALAVASHDRPPQVDAFTVRKAPKAHGTRRRIEGAFREGADVVIVEDVVTTGNSVLSAARAVEEAGGRVLGVLAVVDRGEGGRERIEAAGYRLTALVSLDELVTRAGA